MIRTWAELEAEVERLSEQNEKLKSEVGRLREFVSWVITCGEQDHFPQYVIDRAEELISDE